MCTLRCGALGSRRNHGVIANKLVKWWLGTVDSNDPKGLDTPTEEQERGDGSVVGISKTLRKQFTGRDSFLVLDFMFSCS